MNKKKLIEAKKIIEKKLKLIENTLDKMDENPSRKITAIIAGGKEVEYTKQDIKDFIDNIGRYIDSDNLPGWIYKSPVLINPNKSNNERKKRTLKILQYILNSDENIKINVRSDRSFENDVYVDN